MHIAQTQVILDEFLDGSFNIPSIIGLGSYPNAKLVITTRYDKTMAFDWNLKKMFGLDQKHMIEARLQPLLPKQVGRVWGKVVGLLSRNDETRKEPMQCNTHKPAHALVICSAFRAVCACVVCW